MTEKRLKLGREGEDAAVAFLKDKGYRIIQKNFRSKLGEIDIIAQQKETVIFIEVKSRASHQFGHPFNAITPAKQGKIIQVAQSFLAKHQYYTHRCQCLSFPKRIERPLSHNERGRLQIGEGGSK